MLHPRLNPKYDGAHWTAPDSLQAWQDSPEKTVKLDVLAQVVKHHLDSDGAEPVKMQDDGKTIGPNPEHGPDKDEYPECDRIVVYSAFPSSNGAILDVSRIIVYTTLLTWGIGIPALWYPGRRTQWCDDLEETHRGHQRVPHIDTGKGTSRVDPLQRRTRRAQPGLREHHDHRG